MWDGSTVEDCNVRRIDRNTEDRNSVSPGMASINNVNDAFATDSRVFICVRSSSKLIF